MAQKKLLKLGIKREAGWLYFVNKRGLAARVRMNRRGIKYDPKQEVLSVQQITREQGYLYFIDKDGDLSRAPMARTTT